MSPEFLEKLEAAKLALSHAMPGATAEAVLSAGPDLILARAAKKKGLVEKPRRAAPQACEDGRYVPAEVRREVWKRDGGRCQWSLESGGICGSRLRLQLDHIRPWRLGGPTTAGNLRVLCKVHNDLAAREAYGDALIDRRRTRRRIAPDPQLPTDCEAVGTS